MTLSIWPWRCFSLGSVDSLGLLLREKVGRRGGRERPGRRPGLALFRGRRERMEMFPLQLGHFPDVMPFAGSEDND